jgi:hypothetical protein
MSVKQIGLSSLVALLVGLGTAQAQGPNGIPNGADVLPLFPSSGSDASSSYNPQGGGQGSGGPLSSAFVPAPAGTTPDGIAIDEGSPPKPPVAPIPLAAPFSPYLNYLRAPCCCGGVGTHGGPIGTEMFVRSGVAFPIGNGIFNQYLHAGWDIEGGGRLLLFNPPSTAAWTGILSIGNIFARTGNANQPFTLYRVPVQTAPSPSNPVGGFPITVQVPELTASVSTLNMTFVNIGFGREWWLCGTAYPGSQGGFNWRAGVDGGGRWGSADVQFNEIQHHTGVVGGMYAAIHSDVEYPFRCGIAFGGLRFEYNYIWTHLLQDQNNANFQSLNLMFELGVRF